MLPTGAILTERDRVLLSYVGVARYASAEQLHSLFFDGRSKKQTYRRLAKLCEPGNRPGEGPWLRRLEYRRREGNGVPVWALTGCGRALVVPLVPWLRPPAAHDVGARFLEHTLLLNGVLAGLVRRLRASPAAPVAALPFRWLCEDDGVLEYEAYDRATGLTSRAVLKPDAVLEIPARRRRLFIEAETGSQSIATDHPSRSGAVLAKLARYSGYFHGLAGGGGATWYERTYPDRFEPRLVFLVHSDERYEKVRAAVKGWLGSGKVSRFQVIVLTFRDGARVLAPYVTEGTLAAPAPTRAVCIVSVDAAKVERLREGYGQLAEALRATRDVLLRHNATPGSQQMALPPLRLDAVPALRDFLLRELSASPPARASEPQRGGATHG
jgi:hypothetical protein